LHKGTFPILHACGEGNCVGADIPGFPAGVTMMCVNEPKTMNPKPHAHDFDQYLCFIGSNYKNHPPHEKHEKYSMEEIIKLRGR
jgi:hypothetical protein